MFFGAYDLRLYRSAEDITLRTVNSLAGVCFSLPVGFLLGYGGPFSHNHLVMTWWILSDRIYISVSTHGINSERMLKYCYYERKKRIFVFRKKIIEENNVCPCCEDTLLEDPIGWHDICPTCCWEDDSYQHICPDAGGVPTTCLSTKRRKPISASNLLRRHNIQKLILCERFQSYPYYAVCI
jgi:hypothetical protein